MVTVPPSAPESVAVASGASLAAAFFAVFLAVDFLAVAFLAVAFLVVFFAAALLVAFFADPASPPESLAASVPPPPGVQPAVQRACWRDGEWSSSSPERHRPRWQNQQRG